MIRLIVIAALASLVGCQPAVAWQPPANAERYQRELTRIVQQTWGLDGSVAVHAAQIQQESAWRPEVDSPVGAQGLAQFMPSTSAWIADIYPDSLGPAAPYSPGWAMRAMARYDRWIWQRVDAANSCERWAMTLSGYNGGLGWVWRDQKLARAAGDNPGIWFGSVANYTARAGWAKEENRDYVDRILLRYTPAYVSAWGGRSPCYRF
ncbi:lytic transglycosylase [Salinicola sp. MH3R3-1]|uniref:transglycosylase SLT domain-containing protein n=1 Tax=Salinicola sp. MH3R3-1 TaxID=1928762 RepID=UPI00094EEBA6|nr:transglycosylase SLT domain-containing protein [Salinicola sp. MH3R3-1]OLO06862.1 lytic transglycosylase [Salinicola sp. MH3R3-1]